MPAARIAAYRAQLARLAAGEQITTLETQRVTKDGRTLDVWLTLTALSDDTGRPVAVATTERDITSRKQNEAALVQLNLDLERRVAERSAVAERQAVQLRALAAQLLATEEQERRSLASDLHDNLAQLLNVAKMKIAALTHGAELTGKGPRSRKSGELLDRANQVTRSLMYQLSPPVLHDLGLVPALEWLADEMERIYHLRVTVGAEGHGPTVDIHSRTVLFRAVRELLVNVAKHGGVHNAAVRIVHSDQGLAVAVEDQGVGFDPRIVLDPATRSGFGLFSIRERLNFLGGTLDIRSIPAKKTIVTVSLPLPAGGGDK